MTAKRREFDIPVTFEFHKSGQTKLGMKYKDGYASGFVGNINKDIVINVAGDNKLGTYDFDTISDAMDWVLLYGQKMTNNKITILCGSGKHTLNKTTITAIGEDSMEHEYYGLKPIYLKGNIDIVGETIGSELIVDDDTPTILSHKDGTLRIINMTYKPVDGGYLILVADTNSTIDVTYATQQGTTLATNPNGKVVCYNKFDVIKGAEYNTFYSIGEMIFSDDINVADDATINVNVEQGGLIAFNGKIDGITCPLKFNTSYNDGSRIISNTEPHGMVADGLSGTTSGRPNVKSTGIGYFDTSLGYEVWSKMDGDDLKWVDATGGEV
jgi:hypothetical protein